MYCSTVASIGSALLLLPLCCVRLSDRTDTLTTRPVLNDTV